MNVLKLILLSCVSRGAQHLAVVALQEAIQRTETDFFFPL